jgi:hypothetical protein
LGKKGDQRWLASKSPQTWRFLIGKSWEKHRKIVAHHINGGFHGKFMEANREFSS